MASRQPTVGTSAGGLAASKIPPLEGRVIGLRTVVLWTLTRLRYSTMTSSPDQDRDIDRLETVGVVGVGRAGQWFVTKLGRAGYETVAFDADPEAVADAVDRGAVAADDPADVTARSDAVVLCLPTREAVETVMEGSDGVLEALEPGQVVVDTGTTTPDIDVYYQEQCHDCGASYVDCGMTRHSPGEAEGPREPAYTMFVGGDGEDYVRARPVVEALGHNHEFFEGIGVGHVVKAAVVLRATCRAAVAAEVSTFLSTNGIDPERIATLLEWDIPDPFFDPPYATTRGFDRALDGEGGTESRGYELEDSGARPRLRTSEWAKDPAYALELAHASNSHVPMLTAAYQIILLAENYGSALVNRDLAFNDPEWHLFHLRSVYRALARPQEEWRRLDRWDGGDG